MDRPSGGRKQKFAIRVITHLKEVQMRQEETEKLVKEGEKLGAQGEESMPDNASPYEIERGSWQFKNIIRHHKL